MLKNSNEYLSSFNGKISELKIQQIDENKAGLYKCIAESKYGSTESSAIIKYELNGIIV